MSDLVLPDSIRDVEPVRSIRTPARLDYEFTAGKATTRFLTKVAEKKLVGQECPRCTKVYVPPRGSCPMCGVPTEKEVQVANTGIVTTFCVVNVQFYGQGVEVPYVCATVVHDGADIGLFGMVREMDPHDVRMGLRVEAVWADEASTSLESILHYRPTGEPDAEYDTFKQWL